MQTFHHHTPRHSIPYSDLITLDNLLLFDIETTGLTPDTSTVFMIGCGYFTSDCLHTIHWLADDYEKSSEQEIFQTFSDWFILHFPSPENVHILTYNGQNFDLPFLKMRFEQCHINWPFTDQILEQSIDYYRHLVPLKHLWPIKNLKLHTLSEWLGYTNSHTPSGRQLIKTYHAYIKTKDSALLNLLFLHNMDDLEALSHLLTLESYFQIFQGNYTIVSTSYTESMCVFKIKSNASCPFPAKLEYSQEGISLELQNQDVILKIPVFSNGLRYYYNDYKNYIYLPSEDYALHKSMAKYIDKNHWIKANEKNCYTWFIPDTNFFENAQKQRDYIQMIFRLFRFI